MPLCTERLNDVLQACLKIQVATAEDVYRSILVLWPGMDGQVTLRNNDYAGNPVGAKSMKVATDDGSTHDLGGGAQDALCGCRGSDLTDRTMVQLQVNMSP